MNIIAVIIFEDLSNDHWQIEQFTTKAAALERFDDMRSNANVRRATIYSVALERRFDKDYSKGVTDHGE